MQLAVPPAKRRLLSLTPLIDVVFILIIFFMLATRFDDPRTLLLNTPASRDPAPLTNQSASLEIAGQRLHLDGREVTSSQLRAALARLARRPDPGLNIRVTPRTPLQSLAAVLDLAAQLQIVRVTVTRQSDLLPE